MFFYLAFFVFHVCRFNTIYKKSSVPKIQQSNLVSLLERDTSVSQNAPSMSTPKLGSQHPVQRALNLENGLGNKKHAFSNRYIEGEEFTGG